MDRDTAVTLLKSRLRRAGDSSIAADIILEFQATQARLEQGITLPWFLVSDDTSRTATIGNENFAIPTGFLRLYEEGGALWYRELSTEKWKRITKEDYVDIHDTHGVTLGAPKLYTVEGLNYKLAPIPDKAYMMRTKAYVTDSVLSTNIENNWLKYASDLLLAETGIIMASFYLRNPELAEEMKQWAKLARNTLFVVDEARKHADREYKLGD